MHEWGSSGGDFALLVCMLVRVASWDGVDLSEWVGSGVALVSSERVPCWVRTFIIDELDETLGSENGLVVSAFERSAVWDALHGESCQSVISVSMVHVL